MTDSEIKTAMRTMIATTQNLCEAAGAAALAGLLHYPERFTGRRSRSYVAGGTLLWTSCKTCCEPRPLKPNPVKPNLLKPNPLKPSPRFDRAGHHQARPVQALTPPITGADGLQTSCSEGICFRVGVVWGQSSQALSPSHVTRRQAPRRPRVVRPGEGVRRA